MLLDLFLGPAQPRTRQPAHVIMRTTGPSRMQTGRTGSALALALALGVACADAPEKIVLEDFFGAPVEPLEGIEAEARVFLFVGAECPISNRYAPELGRIKEAFGPRGIEFWLVYTDDHLDADELARHATEFNLEAPLVRDPMRSLVERAGVGVTPEAAVFSRSGELLYRGRIDDRVLELGLVRPEPERRDLRDALDAILAGRKPSVSSTPARGCTIPPAAGSPR